MVHELTICGKIIPFLICSTEATELHRQYTSVKKRLDEATSEKDHLQTAVHKLTGEKKQLDMVVKEYRTESEAILNDYTKATAELEQTKDEKDKLQQLLTKRNQELNQQRERCTQLEKLQKELQDKVLYMDEQVCGYEGRESITLLLNYFNVLIS